MARKHRRPRPSGAMLVNNLSIEDARHILKSEGGEITLAQLAMQAVMIAAVSALTARAIVIGEATTAHLALPMVAEYLTLLITLPIVYLIVRHPDLKKDSVNSAWLLLIFCGVGVATIGYKSNFFKSDWRPIALGEWNWFRNWIVDAHMHWPILLAIVATAIAIPGRVRNLYVHGPPFVGVSLGCAMRFVVLFLGLFTLPFIVPLIVENKVTFNVAWILWGVLLLAEGLALWMHWDIQQRLKKVDAGVSPQQQLPLP